MTEQLFNAVDLSQRKPGMIFRNTDTGQETFIEVTDQFPQMGDMHIEGRRTVTISVELFIELAGLAGLVPVDPNSKKEETNDSTTEA